MARRWQMMRALWEHPKRKQWMGGGADCPGLHSILVDPRDPRSVSIAVSTGGIWHTRTSARPGSSAARACAPITCRRN